MSDTGAVEQCLGSVGPLRKRRGNQDIRAVAAPKPIMPGRSRCVSASGSDGPWGRKQSCTGLLTSHLALSATVFPDGRWSRNLLKLEASKESSTLGLSVFFFDSLGLGVGVWTERSHGQRNIPLRVPVGCTKLGLKGQE
jgi:hypothetical protein